MSDYWSKEPTEEELLQNQIIAQKFDELVRKMKEATPIDSESGEVGKFVRFVGAYPYIKPIYRTPSGKEFFVSKENKND